MAKAKRPVAKKSGSTTARKTATTSRTTTNKTTTPRKPAAPRATAAKAADAVEAKVETSKAVSPSDLRKEMEASGKPAPTVAKEAPSTIDVKPDGATKRTEEPKQVTVKETPPPAPPEENGSVFWPLMFGGLIAGILGFLASELDLLGNRGNTDVLRADISKQDARLTELENADPPQMPEMPEVTFPELEGLPAQVADLSTRLDALDARLTVVEKQPITGGESQAAVAAYERELAALQASVEEQRAEIEGLLDNALSVEEATAAAARAARIQAALSDVSNAINAGQPFDAALANLANEGVSDVPAPLGDLAAEGVQTLNALQTAFPDNARASLGAARASGTDDSESGIGGFLKRQLGARSVTPREGGDPDAVLSRAEAAVREGRLEDALAEIDALPVPAQEAMQEWLDQARARQAAQAATKDLSQSLTAN